jgi:ABC-2 type transport system permease protein
MAPGSNPMMHYIRYFRTVVLQGVFPAIQQDLICLAIAAASLLIGLVVFRINQNQFARYF